MMRCMICNEIIDDEFRIISGQEEICEECYDAIHTSELDEEEEDEYNGSY